MFADLLPGLNTMGVPMVGIDYEINGLNPPHIHPRANEGMVHFQFNTGKAEAVAIAAFNSQNPGIITVVNVLFNLNPPINPEVLTKVFRFDGQIVKELRTKFWYYNQ
ncbi:hypothetical protein CDL15_Pgr000805 [Punica granatum]|nr:hypothetical protein CDL15_Pgr000805 [Punica granatum]